MKEAKEKQEETSKNLEKLQQKAKDNPALKRSIEQKQQQIGKDICK